MNEHMDVTLMIADDESFILRGLKEIVSDSDLPLKLIGTAGNGMDAFALLLSSSPDIAIMDIRMPGMDGLSTAEQLRRSHPDVILIFTTRLSQCAIRGYEVDAIGFLVKPVTLPGLTVKLNKAFKRVEYRQSKICLKTKDSILFLEKNEIYYAEGSNHHVIYHTAQGEFPVRSSLQEAEEQLGAEFSRSSHSYIANLGFVTMVGKNDVTVHGEAIPLSRAMRRDFLNAVNRHYGVR